MEDKNTPLFYDMFDCCTSPELAKYLSKARVESVNIDRASAVMGVTLQFGCQIPPVIHTRVESELTREFGLSRAELTANCPAPEPQEKKTAKKSPGKSLFGPPIKGSPVEMKGVTLDSGRVVIRGRIFKVENKELRGGNCVLGFDMTDETGSLHVTRYMQADEAKRLAPEIKEGMFVTVRGPVTFNRFYNDICIELESIEAAQRDKRKDSAEGTKRVELHLHTRYSALDALTDVEGVIKLAADWGHKALAITDHGVVQAFPEAWKCGEKYGVKILYGTEGYFINDYDDRLTVLGESDEPFDGEFVAFDIETTGLSSERDRITEIGAVIIRNGKMSETFSTFVNPGIEIPPEIVRLTGITDEDVKDAPSEKEAVEAFLEFAGNRPLAAHNAVFDIGFISNACERNGLEFTNAGVDTLVMAQNLLPDLKRHKLDIVAARLGLPEFNHHRATDDALTAGHMLVRFFRMLSEKGIRSLGPLNEYMQSIRTMGNRRRDKRHIIILAKDKTGLKNLYKLVSLGHLKYFSGTPVIPKKELMKHREGLIIGSACESGELMRAIVAKQSWAELKRIAAFYDFLEIQPLCNNAFMLENGTAQSMDELREFNRKVVKLGEELGKPVVATGDVHFLEPEDEIYRRIILASRKFADVDRELPLYFKSTDEMLEEFSYLGEEKAYEVVVENTNLIADMCQPIKLLPDGLFAPVIENSAQQLKDLVYGRLRELYGEAPPEIITKRVETELGDILGRNYDVIYMSAQKLVQRSLEAGYVVGSRGSVGSSIIAYLSGITEVNALPPHYRCPNCKHSDFEAGKDYGAGADMPDAVCPNCGTAYAKEGFNIPFETFLGFGGDKVPDIDLNFSGEYQAQAHKETIKLFGADHVFRAGTIGTIAEKTAYGYVKNYLEERGLNVTKAEEERLALGCVGVKRTTGQHPGGLVIIPQDKEVYDFCPVQHPADSVDTDIITTHFEYHSMEANLLKLDELGHDDPTMIKVLEDLTGVNAREIPLDDKETMSIFKSPKALGLPEDDPIIGKTGSIAIPEFGTSFTKGMLEETQPDKFSTLIRLSGFSHGTDVWLGNARDLIQSNTASLNDVIGCRDDIMIYLMSLGMEDRPAFKIMEAVRKGRGITPEQEQAMKDVNTPDWFIDSCKKIKYLFPKAHAAAYVMMAFRIAWFKVHRPLAFYCAYFSVRADAFDATIMTQGVEKVKAKIREINNKANATAAEKDMLVVLEVVYEFYMRGFKFDSIDIFESDATRFKINGNALRPPFTSIPGLGASAAEDIAERRKGKEFISIEEFSLACPKVSKSHIEQLRAMGAFGDLPETSQISLF